MEDLFIINISRNKPCIVNEGDSKNTLSPNSIEYNVGRSI